MTANPFVRTLAGAEKMHREDVQVPQSEQVGAFSKKRKGCMQKLVQAAPGQAGGLRLGEQEAYQARRTSRR
jgi:adenylate cyclase